MDRTTFNRLNRHLKKAKKDKLRDAINYAVTVLFCLEQAEILIKMASPETFKQFLKDTRGYCGRVRKA